LAHLKALTQLLVLGLGDTQVSNVGLMHLKPLTQLRELNIKGTKVTKSGVDEIEVSAEVRYLLEAPLSTKRRWAAKLARDLRARGGRGSGAVVCGAPAPPGGGAGGDGGAGGVDTDLKDDYKIIIMNLIAIKDLKQPRRLKERLQAEKELLLTSDGRPVAVLVNVDATTDPEAMIQAIRDSRSRLALSRVREAARRSGTAHMDMEQIDREIAAARKARRSRR
jgi:antitoxin (DNA-binding transcriptional repressor) of toxin-antitoxin stability system